jgi:flagellar basal body-associated protein FliL
VPDVALRCPDCKLSKPKASPDQQAAQHKKRQAKRRDQKSGNRPRWVNILAGVVALVLTAGIGLYVFLFFAKQTPELDPHLAQPALANLRQAPSSQSGLSVDDYLTQHLEKSRRVGNLLKFQGWTVSPVKGSKTKLLIAFTYEEKDNTQQRAEWVADVANNTYTPQTDLAVEAYKK